MNSELQAQTDVITQAIAHFETTMHRDHLLTLAVLGVIILLLAWNAVRHNR